MEPNQIKDADILDILFDGRNKEYGAYELRKTYNRRMVKSMVVMVGMLWVRRLRTGSFRVWWLRRRRRRTITTLFRSRKRRSFRGVCR
ncbi:MAG TPA: hypothetical protein VNV35_20425, partial [Puia sp.]|nr:hypothetical protein [Puia sp.]